VAPGKWVPVLRGFPEIFSGKRRKAAGQGSVAERGKKNGVSLLCEKRVPLRRKFMRKLRRNGLSWHSREFPSPEL